MARTSEKPSSVSSKDVRSNAENPFAEAYRAYNARLQEIADRMQATVCRAMDRLQRGVNSAYSCPDPNARFLEMHDEHVQEMRSLRSVAIPQSESAFRDYVDAIRKAWGSLDPAALDFEALQQIHMYQSAALCNHLQLVSLLPPQGPAQ